MKTHDENKKHQKNKSEDCQVPMPSGQKPQKLIILAAELFLQNIVKRFEVAIKDHPAGFTFDIIELELITNFPPDIYLVGQREHAQSFKTEPESDELTAWLCANFSAICNRGGLIGGWWNNKGILFLDVVAVISNRNNAMSSGWINGEEAIYHPYSGNSIEVEPLQIEKLLN